GEATTGAGSSQRHVLAGQAGSGMPRSGAIPSPARGVLGTSRSGKGSLRSAQGQTLAGPGEPEYGLRPDDGMAPHKLLCVGAAKRRTAGLPLHEEFCFADKVLMTVNRSA